MNSLSDKMKALTVLVLAVASGISGYLIKVPTVPISEPTLAPSGWIHLQKLILPLFENVCEESSDPTICKLSAEFTTTLTAGDFWDPEVITRFQNLKSGKGFLPKGQIFSEYNVEHTNELKVIFDVMRNAKTFDTFYKVASWARQNLNCGLYVSLIYLALENRRDTEKLTLPPPYELLPNYFIRKDIIIQGSSLLAGEEFTPSEGVRNEGNAFTLDANYTANFYDNDDESKLAYFREDIGLNSYYFLNMLKLAPWLNENVDINSRYGEEMYHMLKQLVARYNLERYSNGMPEQDNLSWDSLSDAPYNPMLVYSNGNEFIHRTSPVQLPENEDKALLKTIETNIATVVSHMRETGYNKTQILNHLMEILVTGERSYDTLARRLLGKALSNNGQPTLFEHYMTSLRDPMIWRLYKNIVDIVDNALKILPTYTKSELYFPGVEVMSIDVKKLMTNFDYFEFDITEALKIGNGDTTFQVKIGQPRLNHKAFVMKLNISSLVTQKGMIKIYLGPKMMPGEFAKKKNLFSLLDCFETNIKKGSNIITRTSNDMKMFAPDFTSIKTLRKRVEDALFGLDSLSLNSINSQIGFPERLAVPKGTPEGLPLQLFVFVAPIMKTTIGGTYSPASMEFNPAVLSPLYPLDLTMEDRILLDLPNALLKDLLVTHKGVSKVSNYGGSGATKSWYDSKAADGPPSRPNDYPENKDVSNYYDIQSDDSSTHQTQSYQKTSGYDYSSRPKQPNDYKPPRPQYQKTDYSYKKIDYKTLYKNKSTENPIEVKDENKISDKQINIDTEEETTSNSPYEVIPLNKENYTFLKDVTSENIRTQNDNTSEGVIHNLLKSSGFDSSTKQKKSFDYKSIRPKFVKTDYKKIYKTAHKTTETPVNIDNINKDTFNGITEKNIEVENDQDKEVKEEKKNNANLISNDKYEDLVVEDVGNVDIFKVFEDKNVDSPADIPNHKYDKIIIKDEQELESGDYFGIYKDDSNERFVKIVPVTKSPNVKPKNQSDNITTENTEVYDDNKNNEEFIKVVPFIKAPNPKVNNNSIYKYIMRVIDNDDNII